MSKYPYDCHICNTRHPNGWVCPQELKEAQAAAWQLREELKQAREFPTIGDRPEPPRTGSGRRWKSYADQLEKNCVAHSFARGDLEKENQRLQKEVAILEGVAKCQSARDLKQDAEIKHLREALDRQRNWIRSLRKDSRITDYVLDLAETNADRALEGNDG